MATIPHWYRLLASPPRVTLVGRLVNRSSQINLNQTSNIHQWSRQTPFGSKVNWRSMQNTARHYYQLLLSTFIRERVYDKLILFTGMLHKQSNVYLCLRIRRLGQICNLYQRLYSSYELKYVLLNCSLNFLKQLGTLVKNETSRWIVLLSRNRVLLSFATLGIFSWEENRITDQEFNELMKEFNMIENYQSETTEQSQYTNFNNDDSTTPNEPSPMISERSDVLKSQDKEESSFMVVSCQGSQKTVDNWEEVINQPHLHVWRKSVSNTSLYEYRVFGSFFDISANSFYSVQRDLDYRKTWDKLVIKLEVIDTEPLELMDYDDSECIQDSGNELVHWVMKYPYPMKSREYLYVRRSRVDTQNKYMVLISRAVPLSHIPETDEHVRVHDYMSQLVIRPHCNSFHDYGFDYMLTYFDDPRASFPSPCYNWMASKGVPDFVEKLHQAALRLMSGKQQHEVFQSAVITEGEKLNITTNTTATNQCRVLPSTMNHTQTEPLVRHDHSVSDTGQENAAKSNQSPPTNVPSTPASPTMPNHERSIKYNSTESTSKFTFKWPFEWRQ